MDQTYLENRISEGTAEEARKTLRWRPIRRSRVFRRRLQ